MAYRMKRTELRNGEIVLIEKGFAPRIGKKGCRGQIKMETSERQKLINQKRSQQNRINLILNNFNWRHTSGRVTYRGDHWITLTYSKDMRPTSFDEAHKNLCKLVQYIKRKYPDIKYMFKTELPPSGNIHHHLIISRHAVNGVDVILDLIKNRWFCFSSNVKDVEIYSLLDGELANYFIKCEKSHKCDQCKYGQSRNLKKPVIKTKIIKAKSFKREPKPVKGYEVCDVQNYEDYFGFAAQSYRLVRINGRC